MKAIEVLFGYGCNEKCSFCSQESSWRRLPGLPFSLVAEQLYLAARDGYRSVCFTGGEPTLRADLPKLAALARRAGYRYVRVQTNGLRLAEESYARELVEAGATFFRVSIHGHLPELHDRLVRVPGALEKALRGARNAQALGAGVGVNLVINKENVRALPEACAALLDRGLSDFVLIYPLYEGDMAVHERAMGLSMEEAASHARAAVRVFAERGAKPPWLLNFTPCALPELEPLLLSWSAHSALVTDEAGRPVDLYMASHDDRAKPASCSACAYSSECLGFKASYLSRFPALAPVERRAPSARTSGTRILRAEDGLLAEAEEIARALQPVPEREPDPRGLLVERTRVRLDPRSRAISEERAQWRVAHA